MAWNVTFDNVSDNDALWDWDALIQDGTIIFLPGSFVLSETVPGDFVAEETLTGAFISTEIISGEMDK